MISKALAPIGINSDDRTTYNRPVARSKERSRLFTCPAKGRKGENEPSITPCDTWYPTSNRPEQDHDRLIVLCFNGNPRPLHVHCRTGCLCISTRLWQIQHLHEPSRSWPQCHISGLRPTQTLVVTLNYSLFITPRPRWPRRFAWSDAPFPHVDALPCGLRPARPLSPHFPARRKLR